jgi:hypothetical protein
MIRALIDNKGEAFAYLRDGVLFTMEGESTGRVEGNLVVDNAGIPIWRVYGDGVYTLDGFQPIGYFGAARQEK